MERHPRYDDAVAMIRGMSSDTYENQAVRNTARIVSAAIGWRDRFSDGTFSRQDAIDYRNAVRQAATASPGTWGLPGWSPALLLTGVKGAIASVCVDNRAGDRSYWTRRLRSAGVSVPSLGVAAAYASYTDPSESVLTATGANVRRLHSETVAAQERLHTASGIDDISGDELRSHAPLLEAIVRQAAAMCAAAADTMGPRTFDAVSDIRTAVAELSSLCASMQASVRTALAWPDPDVHGDARAAISAVVDRAASDRLCLRTASDLSTVLVCAGECAWGPSAGIHEPMTSLLCRASELVSLSRRALRTDSHNSAALHAVTSRDWRNEISRLVSKADWHLSRSRKSPGLWS